MLVEGVSELAKKWGGVMKHGGSMDSMGSFG